jgi:hypothetical protein
VSLAFEGSSESVDSACESRSQSSPGNKFVADAMDLVLFDQFVSQRQQELVLAGGGWHSVQQLQQLRSTNKPRIHTHLFNIREDNDQKEGKLGKCVEKLEFCCYCRRDDHLRKGSSKWAAAAAVAAVECQAPAIGSHVRIQPRRLCCA